MEYYFNKHDLVQAHLWTFSLPSTSIAFVMIPCHGICFIFSLLVLYSGLWGHLIDESNGFRWLMGWPKFFWVSHNIARKNQTNFWCFFPPPPPTNIYLWRHLLTTEPPQKPWQHLTANPVAFTSKICAKSIKQEIKFVFLSFHHWNPFQCRMRCCPVCYSGFFLFGEIIPDHTSHSHITSFFP